MFFKLFLHCVRREASRTAWIAGRSNATRMPMMAITTNSSTRVKGRWKALVCRHEKSPFWENKADDETTCLAFYAGSLRIAERLASTFFRCGKPH